MAQRGPIRHRRWQADPDRQSAAHHEVQGPNRALCCAVPTHRVALCSRHVHRSRMSTTRRTRAARAPHARAPPHAPCAVRRAALAPRIACVPCASCPCPTPVARPPCTVRTPTHHTRPVCCMPGGGGGGGGSSVAYLSFSSAVSIGHAGFVSQGKKNERGSLIFDVQGSPRSSCSERL